IAPRQPEAGLPGLSCSTCASVSVSPALVLWGVVVRSTMCRLPSGAAHGVDRIDFHSAALFSRGALRFPAHSTRDFAELALGVAPGNALLRLHVLTFLPDSRLPLFAHLPVSPTIGK